MPSTPSISKESMVSSATTSHTSTPPDNNSRQPACTSPSKCSSKNAAREAAIAFPRSHPHRSTYLAIRLTSIFLTLSQIILVAVASGVLRRKRWTDPTLSPATAALVWSVIDVVQILRQQRRMHYLARAIYDALLACGCAVAAGFLVHIAVVPAVRDGDVAATGVAVGILGGMLSELSLHAYFAVGGWCELIRVRRTIRLEDGVDV
ncbi:hypothetical protein B0H63DRAFT_488972, partial [Podospora didyma]